MASGKQECALDTVYEVARLNEKAAPEGITIVVFLDSPLWITLNLMVLYLIVIRTVNLFHVTGRLPLKHPMPIHNLQDPQVKMDQ